MGIVESYRSAPLRAEQLSWARFVLKPAGPSELRRCTRHMASTVGPDLGAATEQVSDVLRAQPRVPYALHITDGWRATCSRSIRMTRRHPAMLTQPQL